MSTDAPAPPDRADTVAAAVPPGGGSRWTRFAGHPLFRDHLPRVGAALVDYARLVRLDRPIGIWLLLWPTLWALWLSSDGSPDEHVFVVFVLGVLLMRSAGCAINDYADREIDPQVERTKARPLAARRIQPFEALVVYAVLSLLALALVLTLAALEQAPHHDEEQGHEDHGQHGAGHAHGFLLGRPGHVLHFAHDVLEKPTDSA